MLVFERLVVFPSKGVVVAAWVLALAKFVGDVTLRAVNKLRSVAMQLTRWVVG